MKRQEQPLLDSRTRHRTCCTQPCPIDSDTSQAGTPDSLLSLVRARGCPQHTWSLCSTPLDRICPPRKLCSHPCSSSLSIHRADGQRDTVEALMPPSDSNNHLCRFCTSACHLRPGSCLPHMACIRSPLHDLQMCLPNRLLVPCFLQGRIVRLDMTCTLKQISDWSC